MDSLLKQFNENRDSDFKQLEREQIKKDSDKTSNPFELKYDNRDYSGQFYHIYQYRLNILRERVERECWKKWDDGFKLNGKPVVKKDKVLDVQANEPCWCIGTIYCEMKYKPNILEDVINDTFGAPDLVKSYTDPNGSDEIMLEDESGRVLLVGDFIRSTPFITGTVVGLLGMEADPGTFQVLDICYPNALPQKTLPYPVSKDTNGIANNNNNNKNEKIALISGLNINTTSQSNLLKLKLLQEYLSGSLHENNNIQKISRLVICGNSIDFNSHSNDEEDRGKLTKSLEEFGEFLGNTLQTISVDIMPGANDPSDRTLPQQPFHKALFKDSLKPYFEDINNQLLDLVTNPYTFNFNGWDMLTLSGQSINDICKYVIPYQENQEDKNKDGDIDMESNDSSLPRDSIEHRLDLMECTLKWQNIAPTAPDTLWCYPYKDNDPFILKEWPHVYIVGNQPDFGTRTVKMNNGTKINMITLPEFSKTGKLVLLDLKNLNTEVVTLDV